MHGSIGHVLSCMASWKGRARKSCPLQSIHISRPDPLTQFVDGQIAQGRDSSSSEYGRELIRVDEKRTAEDQMEEKRLEGLNRAESALTPAKLASPSYRSLGEVDGPTDTAH